MALSNVPALDFVPESNTPDEELMPNNGLFIYQ